jgi:hypothetical protein
MYEHMERKIEIERKQKGTRNSERGMKIMLVEDTKVGCFRFSSHIVRDKMGRKKKEERKRPKEGTRLRSPLC